MSGPPTGDHEGWERFLQLEREQLAERAQGKLARAIGLVLPGEDWEELNRLAREDESRARQGLVELRQCQRVWHKHIDDLTREDRPARLPGRAPVVAEAVAYGEVKVWAARALVKEQQHTPARERQ